MRSPHLFEYQESKQQLKGSRCLQPLNQPIPRHPGTVARTAGCGMFPTHPSLEGGKESQKVPLEFSEMKLCAGWLSNVATRAQRGDLVTAEKGQPGAGLLQSSVALVSGPRRQELRHGMVFLCYSMQYLEGLMPPLFPGLSCWQGCILVKLLLTVFWGACSG